MFLLDGNANLSRPAKRALDHELETGGRIGLSAISLWEISCLHKGNRLVLSRPLDEWLDLATGLSFVTVLGVDGSIAREAASLPDLHRDPADRFILATARLHNLPVVSADRRFADYPGIRVLW